MDCCSGHKPVGHRASQQDDSILGGQYLPVLVHGNKAVLLPTDTDSLDLLAVDMLQSLLYSPEPFLRSLS